MWFDDHYTKTRSDDDRVAAAELLSDYVLDTGDTRMKAKDFADGLKLMGIKKVRSNRGMNYMGIKRIEEEAPAAVPSAPSA